MNKKIILGTVISGLLVGGAITPLANIKTDLQKVEILTKELEELKTNSNYQVLSYSKTNIKPMIQPNNEYKQKKILTRNK